MDNLIYNLLNLALLEREQVSDLLGGNTQDGFTVGLARLLLTVEGQCALSRKREDFVYGHAEPAVREHAANERQLLRRVVQHIVG